MSRIGNKAITIPAGVEVSVAAGNEVTVKGPKGTLTKTFSPLMEIEINENVLTVKRPNEEKHTKQLHGTTRALIATMIEGCHQGFTKVLKVVGIGYRVALAGNKLTLNVGFSHPVEFTVPAGVEVACPDANTINVSGIDKQVVGQFAAVVRAIKNVFRSNKHIFVQVIDDTTGNTLCAVSSLDLKLENGGNIEAAKQVGAAIAEKCKAKNIESIRFDRGGYVYHGRVQALAEAAREAGLKF